MGYTESGIFVVGLNEMVAGLQAMGAEKELLALNLKVGKLVEDKAKQNLTQSLIKPSTGTLAGSIKTMRSLKGVTVVAGKDPLIPYANVQNWGWFYDRDYLQAKNIKPKQFMNKAAARVRGMVADMYIEDLIKIYEKYSGKTGTLSKGDYFQRSINYTTRR